MAVEVRWRGGWFKGVALDASDLIEGEARAVAGRANAALPAKPGLSNPNFAAGLDIDAGGWPRGYAVAANTYSQRAEARRKILASSL